jgi:hypothetical protein
VRRDTQAVDSHVPRGILSARIRFADAIGGAVGGAPPESILGGANYDEMHITDDGDGGVYARVVSSP